MSLAAAPATETPASPFSRGTVLALLLAGIFSFSVLAVLASFAPDLRTGGDPRAHALSKSAVGFGGLVKLLETQGQRVVISRNRAAPGGAALYVLTPGDEVKASEVEKLTAGGATLLILPKWEIGPDLRSRDWVTRVGETPLKAIAEGPLNLRGGVTLKRRKGVTETSFRDADGNILGSARITGLQALEGAKLDPLVVDQDGGIILGELDLGGDDDYQPIMILSDPDLLNTYALRDLAGARLAMAVLNQARPREDSPVFFDVTLNGYERGRNLWKLAFEPPFLAATLCALVAGVLMGLHAAVRFGAARREERAIGMGKRGLADNQAGLIRMAKREPRMAVPYLKLIRDRTARRVGTGQVAEEADLERLLDRLGERRTELKITELSAEARQVADLAGLMRLARRLHQWKLEISRERH